MRPEPLCPSFQDLSDIINTPLTANSKFSSCEKCTDCSISFCFNIVYFTAILAVSPISVHFTFIAWLLLIFLPPEWLRL